MTHADDAEVTFSELVDRERALMSSSMYTYSVQTWAKYHLLLE